ncbi:hypothetical protein NX059_012106 [Plenodomus lindquistii]|nr:hypothetical protein NX059_012106 [Plenodomus lindquistii]
MRPSVARPFILSLLLPLKVSPNMGICIKVPSIKPLSQHPDDKPLREDEAVNVYGEGVFPDDMGAQCEMTIESSNKSVRVKAGETVKISLADGESDARHALVTKGAESRIVHPICVVCKS